MIRMMSTQNRIRELDQFEQQERKEIQQLNQAKNQSRNHKSKPSVPKVRFFKVYGHLKSIRVKLGHSINGVQLIHVRPWPSIDNRIVHFQLKTSTLRSALIKGYNNDMFDSWNKIIFRILRPELDIRHYDFPSGVIRYPFEIIFLDHFRLIFLKF